MSRAAETLRGALLAGIAPTTNPWPTVLVSAAMGFVVGALFEPVPLVSLEGAQVVAGVVDLPAGNPMNINHTSTYSLFLIQLPALLLWLGTPEYTLATVGSGMQMALAFSALAICALAFSHNRLLAVATPILLYKVPNLAGHKYPTELVTDAYDAGMFGLYAVLFVVGLLGLGRFRSGLFLLAVLPAVHPSLGVAAWVMAGAAFLTDKRRFAPVLRSTWRFLIAGLAILGLTYLVQRAFIQEVPAGIDMDAARQLTNAFETNWDGHRMPAGFGDDPKRIFYFFEVDFYLLGLALLLLTIGRTALSDAGRFILIGLLATSAVALVLTVATELSLTAVPLEIRALMLTRWLNLNSALFPVMVMGVLAYLGFTRHQTIALVGLLACLVLLSTGLVDRETLLRANWLGFPEGRPWDAFGLLFPVASLFLVVLVRRQRRAVARDGWSGLDRGALVPLATAAVLMVVVLRLGASEVHGAYGAIRHYEYKYLASTSLDRRALDVAGDRPGLLITPIELNQHWPQLNSRRGLVIDPDIIDLITYVPAAAPSTERVLRDLYGTSVHNADGWDSLSGVRGLWEQRSLEEWQRIRRDFNGTDVLTPRSWKLRLPIVTTSDQLALYRITPTAGVNPGRSN